MNIVGKMLVVLQLVFSILFICFGAAVYSHQGAWRNLAVSLQGKLETAESQRQDEIESRNNEVKLIQEKLSQAESDRDFARAELQTARTNADEFQRKEAQAAQERDKALADGQIATAEAAARVAESVESNKEIQSLRERINELISEKRLVENDLLDKVGRLSAAEEKETLLLEELASLRDILRYNGISEDSVIPGNIAGKIEPVDGFVKKTLRNTSRTQEYVHITVGSDDGIRKDMEVTVFRESDYICRARVINVYADEAVCVVLEKTRSGVVARGDKITTRL